MKSVNIKISVSYSQICIFWSSIPEPFNFWTETHVDQGFAWREGSVGFRTLVDSGPHLVQIDFVDNFDELDANVVRAFQVPFCILNDGNVELASISDGVRLSMPAGNYALRCEFYGPKKEGLEFVRLIFCRSQEAIFSVIRKDEYLSVPEELLTVAEPAH